jgi:MFS family permease
MGVLLDRFGERRMLPVSYLGLAVCCIGFATVSNIWVLQGLLLTIKLLIVLGMGLPTYVNRIAPTEELAPTLSAGTSINHVTSVAMPMVAGVLLPVVGYSGVFLGTAGLILLSIPFALSLRTEAPAVVRPQPVMAE